MKWSGIMGLTVILSSLTSHVLADPISNKYFSTYDVLWVSSHMTVCSQVCKKKSSVAEGMKLSSVSTQDIFVCRVEKQNSNEYGTNTSDNCLYFDNMSLKPQKAADFQCLCVKEKHTIPPGISVSYVDIIETRHKELQGKENNLDAQIANCRALNNDMKRCDEELAKRVSSYKNRIDELEAAIKRGENQHDALIKIKESLQNDLKQCKKVQVSLQKELSYRKKIRSQVAHSPKLDVEISKLEKTLAQLKKNTAALAALYQRI